MLNLKYITMTNLASRLATTQSCIRCGNHLLRPTKGCWLCNGRVIAQTLVSSIRWTYSNWHPGGHAHQP